MVDLLPRQGGVIDEESELSSAEDGAEEEDPSIEDEELSIASMRRGKMLGEQKMW